MQSVQEFAREVRSRVVALERNDFDAEAVIGEMLDDAALLGDVVENELLLRAGIRSEVLGYGVLQPYLDNPEIEELWINRPNEVRFAKTGEVQANRVDLPEEAIRTLVLRMLRNSGRRVDTSLPFADAVLDDGSRLHVVIPDVTARNWSVNIRKFPKNLYSLEQLLEFGSVTLSQAQYLRAAIKDGKNILVSGATHSGKTTMLVALLNELSANKRLISCEETFELRSNLPDWVAMQARQPNLEGQGEIPLRRLVKESLRMRPDVLVIGEVREAEALDLLVAMNSGVAGACTIHANSAQAAITKLCTLPLLAGPNISATFVEKTVAEAIDLVIHCENTPMTGRRVSAIAQVTARADGTPLVEELQW